MKDESLRDALLRGDRQAVARMLQAGAPERLANEKNALLRELTNAHLRGGSALLSADGGGPGGMRVSLEKWAFCGLLRRRGGQHQRHRKKLYDDAAPRLGHPRFGPGDGRVRRGVFGGDPCAFFGLWGLRGVLSGRRKFYPWTASTCSGARDQSTIPIAALRSQPHA